MKTKTLTFTEDELKALSTIVFEFIETIDTRRDKHGNLKNNTWEEEILFADKYLSKLRIKGVEND